MSVRHHLVTPSCWHVDILRAHMANRCVECHPNDCFLCGQAAMLGLVETP